MTHSQAERVLITGGAGFIGPFVARECAARGMEVVVYDNLSYGRKTNLERIGVKVTLIQGDVRDLSSVENVLRSVRPRYIFHLAAVHYIPYCEAHPEEALSTNVLGTFNILKASLDSGVRRCVVASSGAVYLDFDRALSEDMPVAASDVYSLSKLLTEAVTRFFTSRGLSCIIARIFNVYGPGETNPHIIPTILDQLRQGHILTLGSMDRIRDYIFVEDAARILAELLYADAEMYPVVNVGTGQGHSVRDIVAIVEKLLGRHLIVVTDPARIRKVDKRCQVASTDRLARAVEQTPRYTLEQGLRRLLEEEGLL